MRTIRAFVLTLGAWLAAGCVSTINPLYTKDNSVQDPRIEGIWFRDDLNVDGETRRASLSIRPHDDGALPFESDIPGYTIALDTVNTSEVFEAKLVVLGAHRYLDVYSLKDLSRPDVVPVHNILRVTLVNNQLAVAAIDRQKLERVITSEEPSLAMAHIGGRVVLTGSTAELQAFLSAHGDKVFGVERRFSKRVAPDQKRDDLGLRDQLGQVIACFQITGLLPAFVQE